jgi:glycosyltransferase involved in cell wall biosynthesis
LSGDHSLSVLFIHPSYPNIFARVIEELAGRPDIRCGVMVENRCRDAVRASGSRATFYGYDPADLPSHGETDAYMGAFATGVRRGLGVARTLRILTQEVPFDVVLGSASNGCTFFLRSVVSSAIVSHCEHPGYFIQSARPEFPRMLDQYVHDLTYRSLVLGCVAHSELGLVASDHARALFPAEFHAKVRVQSEGCELPRLPPSRRAWRRPLGLPVDSPLIGFFGRSLEAVRGFDVFLHVFKRVRELRPEVQAVVIGSETTLYGNEERYLGGRSFKQYALESAGIAEGDVIWRGFLPYQQFLAHLACLDVAILPTFEGASNWSFFDAMASAVPILSSIRSYVPELITHGKEGYLFDPYDLDSYAEATLRLLDSPDEAARIGRAARARVRRDHTTQRAADGYEAIIREALRLRNGRP